jgi:hypothetical protein
MGMSSSTARYLSGQMLLRKFGLVFATYGQFGQEWAIADMLSIYTT